MTVFGRDTLITCLQTLLFGPELARTALEVLAELQARDDNPDVDAEPGKIVHELRSGKAAQKWFRTYYGTVDATPLYLVLLSEVWRWTDDARLRARAEGAGAGGAALDRRVRRPRRRRLRRVRAAHPARAREPVVEGLAATRSASTTARSRARRSRRSRCRATSTTRSCARPSWRARSGATGRSPSGSSARRRSCSARSTSAFWTDARGGYYVLALDGEKRQVDSLCSNIGHLLWSGIVPSRSASTRSSTS